MREENQWSSAHINRLSDDELKKHILHYMEQHGLLEGKSKYRGNGTTLETKLFTLRLNYNGLSSTPIFDFTDEIKIRLDMHRSEVEEATVEQRESWIKTVIEEGIQIKDAAPTFMHPQQSLYKRSWNKSKFPTLKLFTCSCERNLSRRLKSIDALRRISSSLHRLQNTM